MDCRCVFFLDENRNKHVLGTRRNTMICFDLNFKCVILYIEVHTYLIADVGVGIYENSASGCKSTENCTNYGLIMFLNCLNIFLGPLIFLALVRQQHIKNFCHTIRSGRFFKPSTQSSLKSENTASNIEMMTISRTPTQN